jgi:recombination associated protein RdgC
MTWNGRVSFVLSDTLTLKKIKLLDVVVEGNAPGKDDDGFDADVALCTGELGRLIPDLVAALDGERPSGPTPTMDGGHDEPHELEAAVP